MAEAVVPFAPKSNSKSEAGDPLDRAGQAILGALHRAAGAAEANYQRAIELTQLNGKKAAIGVLGALLTAWLSNVPQTTGGTGLVSVLSIITSAVPGLSGFTMPLFLALSAWGVLGKLEKWAQGTAPPPQPSK